MKYLTTVSGYTLIPPSGLTIVVKSLQLDTINTSGSIRISGSAGTMNDIFTAISPIVMDVSFLQRENVTIIPASGTAIINYIYAGEPDAMKYAYGVSWYSQTAPASGYHQRWVGSFSLFRKNF